MTKLFSEKFITEAFEFFRDIVLLNTKLTSEQTIALFIKCITEPENYFVDDKNNYISTPNKQIPCNKNAFLNFRTQYSSVLVDNSISDIIAYSDRFKQEFQRRLQGAFFTPVLFVNKAHKMIEQHLGDNWREKYTVWDCACGTLNLTKNYSFKNLYCSTLLNEELELSSEYNKNSTKWQMDFLNDDLTVIPEQLKNDFEQNKPFVFFINPPYGKNSGVSKFSGTSSSNCYTKTKKEMITLNLDGTDNLQHQFMFRITQIAKQFNLTNAYLALFSNPVYLTGQKTSKFSNYFLSNFKKIDAYLFQASHFADVSPTWGISLTLWKFTPNNTIDSNIKFKLLNISDNGTLIEIGVHTFYNYSGVLRANKWVREPLKNKKTFLSIPWTSALKINEECKFHRGRKTKNSLGFFYSGSNNVGKNTQEVSIFSDTFAVGQGCDIIPDNFERCVTLFTARKCIKNTWYNHDDQYIAPDIQHPDWNIFKANSIVYALFNLSSNQVSLRKINYKGISYTIKNEFFWLNRSEVKKLAITFNNIETQNDIEFDTSERFVYNMLTTQDIQSNLLPISNKLLVKANDLITMSFDKRHSFDKDNPKYQLNNWDAGFYQLKQLWRMYFENEYNEFKKLYSELENQLIPLVYSVGFLKNED